MISSLDPMAQSFLRGLEQIQQRSQQAQRELTTGLRINTVSDDPDQIASLLQTRADLQRTQQINSNLGRVKTEVDTAEGVLQTSTKLMDRVQTLGTQGQSAFTTAEVRQNLSDELGSLLEQFVSMSRTSVEGRYIFSGDSDQTAPYTIDLTQPSPISVYQGTAATRQAQHPDGSLFTVSRTAQDIFDSPIAQDNVFASINSLRMALANNDQPGINAALANVQSSATYLNTQLSFYGTAQSRVESGIEFGKSFETQLQGQLSGIQDADLAQAVTELTQAQTEQQAALSSRARLPRTSLFDYLG